MQLRLLRWADAEQTFWRELALRPASGWALRGLARSLRGHGREAEAGALGGDIGRSWGAADAGLLARN